MIDDASYGVVYAKAIVANAGYVVAAATVAVSPRLSAVLCAVATVGLLQIVGRASPVLLILGACVNVGASLLILIRPNDARARPPCLTIARAVWITTVVAMTQLYQWEAFRSVAALRIGSLAVLATIGVLLVVSAVCARDDPDRPIAEAILLGGAFALRFEDELRDLTGVTLVSATLWQAAVWSAALTLRKHRRPQPRDEPSP